MKKVIGLTGTTGSGKSTVSKVFLDQGFYIIDCDKVARYVVENDKKVLSDLSDRFGKDIFNNDGSLNRKLLASKAFADSDSTKALDNITLPAIKREVNRLIDISEKDMILLDAPTLFESGADKLCDITICVTAPTEQRISRIIHRDGINRAQAEQRISAQHDDEFFIKKCTYVINNGGDIKILTEFAEELVINIIKDLSKG